MHNIIKFGMELIDLLIKDERFSFAEGDLQLFADGLMSDSDELAKIISETNRVYHNSNDEELHGNYLICKFRSDKNTNIQKNVRFNLDAYYQDSLKSDINTIKENIAQELLNKKADTGIDDALSINEYEKLKSKLIIRAINFSNNYLRLEDAVYKRFGDMAICAYMKVSNGNGQFLSAKIPKGILDTYNISAEQLMEDAVSNSRVLFPERLYFSAREAYGKAEGYSADETLELVRSGKKVIINSTLVLTNSIHLNGASALFYPGIPEKIGEIFGGDYYAVCLSIHDVWLHAKDSTSLRRLKDSLYQTNAAFNDGDMLTNFIYRYDVRRKQFKEIR